MFQTHSLILLYLYKAGPIVLFLSLVMGIIGIPLPDELLLMSAGYLVAHNKLNLWSTLIAACLGSMCGITLSYWFGRLIGKWFIKRFGNRLNLTEAKMRMAESWFLKIGKWILIIGYFIPFFRHLFGFAAGGAKMDYKHFAMYAYTGALIWSVTFLSIGYFFQTFVADLLKK